MGRRRTPSPRTGQCPSLSDGDIYEAMKEIPGYLDVTPSDLPGTVPARLPTRLPTPEPAGSGVADHDPGRSTTSA